MLNLKPNENSHRARAKIILYKNRGETPLECLLRFKKDNPKYKDEKMTYAGRLDPLAEGLLLVLIGDECKNKEKYLGIDKEYEVDMLFGFATDTYDILGIPQKFKNGGLALRRNEVTGKGESSVFEQDMIKVLQSFVGRFKQKYPPYSSRYFSKARSGELKDEEISEKEVEIKNIKLLSKKTISKKVLEKYIIKSIKLVKGDFRQKEILSLWNKAFRRSGLRKFDIVSIKVKCTSGTYMRSLANNIGKKVGIPALALNIKRTKIGKYRLASSF